MGEPLVLAAAILILAGLLPALYSSRRKVWVRADPDGDGAVLRVGGLAMHWGGVTPFSLVTGTPTARPSR